MDKHSIPTIDKIKFVIETFFKQAYQDTDQAGRHSPCTNFMNSLEDWCQKTNRDYRVWQLSMYRLFSIKSKFPNMKSQYIIGSVFAVDKNKLGL